MYSCSLFFFLRRLLLFRWASDAIHKEFAEVGILAIISCTNINSPRTLSRLDSKFSSGSCD